MADKKLVEAITSRDEDFAQWYTDICVRAGLIGYTSVKGCMVIKPLGYAIWENIQNKMNVLFKETGVENVYMPLFIPESLLQKEKDHVEGFAPEVAWVTHGGLKELNERMCVRPTSETLFCDFYHDEVHSYRDLPKVYNQWCSVVRWEKETRPFLRSREFLWQEGHTIHATYEEAEERTVMMLNLYADFMEKVLAIPVIKGQKTDKEKFAGAIATYTMEAMMHDGKALQSGTSHNFGDGFAKAFEIMYTDKDNTQKYPFQTSWGVSTRMLGALIMVHGDDSGLVLPPEIAPKKVVIVPIRMQDGSVMEAVNSIAGKLKEKGISAYVDDTEKSPGWKFAEAEMKGVPLRIELGPKDLERGVCVAVRRDNGEKQEIAIGGVCDEVPAILGKMQQDMYDRAKSFLESHISDAHDYEEFKDAVENKPGFIRAMWCGDVKCEEKIKEDTTATSRCARFGDDERISEVCVCCGKPAKKLIYWGKAY